MADYFTPGWQDHAVPRMLRPGGVCLGIQSAGRPGVSQEPARLGCGWSIDVIERASGPLVTFGFPGPAQAQMVGLCAKCRQAPGKRRCCMNRNRHAGLASLAMAIALWPSTAPAQVSAPLRKVPAGDALGPVFEGPDARARDIHGHPRPVFLADSTARKIGLASAIVCHSPRICGK